MTAARAGGFRRLAVLIAVNFVDMVGFMIVLPLLPFYALELEASPELVGLLIASFSIAQLVAARHVDAGEPAFQRRRGAVAPGQRGRGQGGGARHKLAALQGPGGHAVTHQSDQRARISSSCGTSGANSATRAGSKCLPACAVMWSSAFCTGQGSL